jgi:signal transduction histidine kinase
MRELGAWREGRDGAAFEVMSDAVLGILGELSVDAILQKLVDASRELGRARYAALGIPDGRGGFAKFLTAGMSDARAAMIGDLPRTHGLLGATLDETRSWRVPDIRQDPRFEGWPSLHPEMRAFMGVPISLRGRVIGAFYLTHTAAARRFSDDDQRVIELLAAHAAVAIENARLFERSRELSVVEERNRLARELHDSVTQTLFSLDLTAAAAATLIGRDPRKATAEIERLQELARSAIAEMRALVFELRAPELDSDGFVATLRKHVDILRRVHRTDVRLEVRGDGEGCGCPDTAADLGLDPVLERELLRVAQEALSNALRHARARSVRVVLEPWPAAVRLVVSDDGVGFDPDDRQVRATHLGLTSMRERARDLGGSLEIVSAPGSGTEVRLEVPRGQRS